MDWIGSRDRPRRRCGSVGGPPGLRAVEIRGITSRQLPLNHQYDGSQSGSDSPDYDNEHDGARPDRDIIDSPNQGASGRWNDVYDPNFGFDIDGAEGVPVVLYRGLGGVVEVSPDDDPARATFGDPPLHPSSSPASSDYVHIDVHVHLDDAAFGNDHHDLETAPPPAPNDDDRAPNDQHVNFAGFHNDYRCARRTAVALNCEHTTTQSRAALVAGGKDFKGGQYGYGRLPSPGPLDPRYSLLSVVRRAF